MYLGLSQIIRMVNLILEFKKNIYKKLNWRYWF